MLIDHHNRPSIELKSTIEHAAHDCGEHVVSVAIGVADRLAAVVHQDSCVTAQASRRLPSQRRRGVWSARQPCRHRWLLRAC
jgi:hypothetical protein